MKKKLQDVLYFLVVISLIVIIAWQGQKIEDIKNEEAMLQGGDIYKAELLDSISQLRIDMRRYEVALDILKSEDSVAAHKFEDKLYSLE